MIVAMKKACIACLADERDKLIDTLFSLEKVMLIPLSDAESGGQADIKLKELEKLRKDIKPYEPEKGLLSTCPEITEDRFDNIDPDSVKMSDTLRKKLTDFDDNKTSIAEYKKRIAELEPWIGLTCPAESVHNTEFTSVFTGFMSESGAEALPSELMCADIYLLGSSKNTRAVIILCASDAGGDVLAQICGKGFNSCTLPVETGLVRDEYDRCVSLLENARKVGDKLRQEIIDLAKYGDELALLTDQYRADAEKQSAPARDTEETVYIEGWIRADDQELVRTAVCSAVPEAAVDFSDPDEGESVPTATKNSKLISNFEAITNMFSVPSPNELDPNPIMAPWYWIIYGMMMGDVGYGFIMLIGGLLYKKFLKPRKGTAKLCNIITLCGITTFIFGIVYNSYFCVSLDFMPSYSIISIENPSQSHILEWLIISVGIGFLHIFTALIVNMYTSFKARDWMTAVFDNLSWILIFVGLAVMVVGAFAVPVLKTPGIIVALVGAAMIVIFGGRSKTGLGKITGGLVSLYGITSFVSDALSYTRIIALAISTGIIGLVMNILAEKVLAIPIAGYVLSAVVCIIGHAFNIVMGLLSAYVHDGRLQFIEFFGRFFTGGGVSFKPFAKDTKEVSVIRK